MALLDRRPKLVTSCRQSTMCKGRLPIQIEGDVGRFCFGKIAHKLSANFRDFTRFGVKYRPSTIRFTASKKAYFGHSRGLVTLPFLLRILGFSTAISRARRLGMTSKELTHDELKAIVAAKLDVPNTTATDILSAILDARKKPLEAMKLMGTCYCDEPASAWLAMLAVSPLVEQNI